MIKIEYLCYLKVSLRFLWYRKASWPTPVTPGLQRLKQEYNLKFKEILSYIVISKPTWYMEIEWKIASVIQNSNEKERPAIH